MRSLFGKIARLSKLDHSSVIESGRGVEFHLQDVEFDDDDIPGEVIEFPVYEPPPFLSPDGKTVFTVLSHYSRMDHMGFRKRYFIVRHSLTDGQGSYFRIAEFDDINYLDNVHFYALSNDRLGALIVDRSQKVMNQYVIRIGHQPRLAEVIAHRSFPIENPYTWDYKASLQLNDRIVLSDESLPIHILAADIEAPESKKYCHCCRLDGYYSRLKIEALNRNVYRPSLETLTLGRNGVYVGINSFCVVGLEWQRNNELPADLCHRRVEDTVPVFYRFDQQFANIHDGDWFNEVASNGLVVLACRRMSTLDVFILDLTRLICGDVNPEMRCTQSTISVGHLNLVPGTSSVVIELGYPSNFIRLRSAFDVPPLRQLAFEAVYKHMRSEERSKPGWMQALCGFECV